MKPSLIQFLTATAIFWALALTLFVVAHSETLEDTLKDPDTFAVCKTVDLASTAVILKHGGTELNPIMRTLFAHGWLLPIGISVGIWYMLHEDKNDTATEVANGVTCGVAAHNLLVM